MSKWFPDVSQYEGARSALNSGFYACFAFAALNCLGIAMLLFTGREPIAGEAVSQTAAAIIGIVIEMTFVLVAAWRFRIGKGLVIGSITLLLFGFEIFSKIVGGTAHAVWLMFYAAIFVGLINGLRGAWASRSNSFEDAETFS